MNMPKRTELTAKSERDAIHFTQASKAEENALDYASLYPQATSQDLLEKAIEDNNPNLLRWAIQQGANTNAIDKGGKTPLHHAAEAGHAELVWLLLGIPGTNVNAADYCNRTPLHFATGAGHIEIVRLLLSVPETNINAATCSGKTPLHYAANPDHVEVVHSQTPPLPSVTIVDHTQVIQLLLAMPGINVNATDTWDNSLALLPQWLAAGEGRRLKVICLLLAAGADFSIKNDLGKTAFSKELITESPIREVMITQYKRLLAEGPVERLKFKAATALFKHLNGKEEYNGNGVQINGIPESEIPEEVIFLYRLVPYREKNKGNYFNMRAFCERNLHLTDEEKEKYSLKS